MTTVETNLEETTEIISQLKDNIARYKFEIQQAEKELEKQELKLINVLEKTGVDNMQYGVYSFGWKTSKRKAFDQKLFSSKHPDLFDEFKIEKESTKFEFKING